MGIGDFFSSMFSEDDSDLGKGNQKRNDGKNGLFANKVLQGIVDSAGVNIMMANIDETIVYVNQKSTDNFYKLKDELRKAFPNFDPTNVIGGSIHNFHKDPERVKSLLRNLRAGESHSAKIRPGELIFDLTATAVGDENGNKIGYAVQWADITQEMETARLSSAMDGSQTAAMQIDRDFKITFINPATVKLIQKNIEHFQKSFPGFSLENVVGSCIDQYHKNPAHQRNILSSTANLPYNGKLQVGDLIFDINVTAITDPAGNYIGNHLEWADITEKLKADSEVARLSGLVEDSGTNMMICDRDFNISYCNKSMVQMFSKYEGKLKSTFYNFDTRNLVGQNIDQFHKNPSHQRGILNNVHNLPITSTVKTSGLTFSVYAFALFDKDGKHIGNAAEWVDENAKEAYKQEVEKMIHGAETGDLSVRGDVDKMDEFYGPILEGINSIVDSTVAPINELKDRLEEIAQGDLTAYVVGDYKGDHATLKEALNNTLDSLNNTLNQVQQASLQFVASSNEMSATGQTLSQGASEQAASLEEISATINEMTAQLKQSEGNTGVVKGLADEAKDFAESGNKMMHDMLEAMTEIETSSNGISKIIKVIDEIAMQTNLLALNAAVEAARAGDAGLGFAVVADEVRNLAQRSAKAARETTELIQSSITKVTAGTSIAQKTSDSLKEIVESNGKVANLIEEINAATKEQATGISQINTGVSQLESVTQQNSSSAEESAASAEELNSQANHLQQMVDAFKLKS